MRATPLRKKTARHTNGASSILTFVALALLLSALSVGAQPKMNSLSPNWIQRGATLTTTIGGESLGSVTGLVFVGEAGLSATIVVETSPPPAVTVESSTKAIAVATAPGRDKSKSIKAQITATAEAALGDREVRLLGTSGVSEPLTITVGAVPQIIEEEPNNTVEQAQKVSLPASLAGIIQGTTEVDAFRFSAKKGEQFVLEVMAQRIGSPLDSSLVVLDSNGKELARNEDARGFDSLIEFTAPEDGDYIAQLRDFQYRGGGDYRYQLFVGVMPYVDYVFPFGGQRGKPVDIAVTGRNLQGSEKMTLNIDANSPLGRQEIRLSTPRGLSNPIQFDVQDLPEMAESEPNDGGTNVNALTVPGIVNGRIGAAKDVDRFSFKPATDGKLVVDIEARRYGSPLDSLVAVYAGESLVAQNDDADGTDARMEFDAKKDTEYNVVVRDLTGRGGKEYGYRLSVRPAVAAVPTFAAKYFPDAVRLNRGGRTRIRCEVVRTGFDTPVQVSASDLPDGVSVEPIIIPAGRNEGDMLIFSTADAKIGTTPLKLSAIATIAGKPVTQTVTPIAPQEAAEKAFKRGFLTVLGTAPFTIEALTLATSMDQLKSGNIDVLVNRRPGFNGEVKLSAIGFSLGRAAITKSFDAKEVTVKGDASTGQLKLTARVDSELGTRHVLVRGEATDGGEKSVQFSHPVAVTVAQIPFVLSTSTAKLTLNMLPPGATNFDQVEVKVRADRRNFTDAIPLAWEGVPEGVNLEGTNMPANVSELVVKIAATEKVKPGTNILLSVQGTATFKDRIYRHKPGAIQLTISPPEMVELATNTVTSPKQP
jgi:hypothetical protein